MHRGGTVVPLFVFSFSVVIFRPSKKSNKLIIFQERSMETRGKSMGKNRGREEKKSPGRKIFLGSFVSPEGSP